MVQPAINLTELDGALGVLPASAGKLYALAGVSSSGPTNTPAAFGRVKDIIATFGSGPLVEAMCAHVERTGRPVIGIRTGSTVAGLPGTAVVTGVTGTSVVTIGTAPNDDYEPYFIVRSGGTIGVAGITFQWSLDGGRTLSPVTALGTATSFAFPGAGGLALAFAAGTLVAGDVVTGRTTAPNWNASELGLAIEALKNSIQNWEILGIVGPLDATGFDMVETKFASLFAAGKPRAWIGHVRMPNVAESESSYKTALDAIFAAKATVFGMVCAGAMKIVGSVNGRSYRRPTFFIVGSTQAAADEDVDIADPNRGPLSGVSIRDANGNPDEHDESINPGLDDSRFCVLRTWEGLEGVYVNRPQLLSPSGSDFQLMPHRRVLNLAHIALRAYFVRRLNQPIRVSVSTGFILEAEALEIEAGATQAMKSVLTQKPKASAVQFALSRTDNVLSTKTLTGDARVIPLAYVEFINLTLGFLNPALQFKKVA